MPEERVNDPAALRQGLTKIRKRRWILWAAVLIYVPGLLIVLELQASGRIMGLLFLGWLALISFAVCLATIVKCPGCAKTFHTNGPTFLPVRRCVHCGLALNADKRL